MSPEKQNMAIAEACGWLCVHCESYSEGDNFTYGPRGMPPHGNLRRPIPDYLNDLNAMHDAEQELRNGDTWQRYASALQDVCQYHCVGIVPAYPRDLRALAFIAHATAAQRAESFLRTIGKWDDSK